MTALPCSSVCRSRWAGRRSGRTRFGRDELVEALGGEDHDPAPMAPFDDLGPFQTGAILDEAC